METGYAYCGDVWANTWMFKSAAASVLSVYYPCTVYSVLRTRTKNRTKNKTSDFKLRTVRGVTGF